MTQRLKQVLVALGGYGLCLVFVFLGLWQMQVFQSQKSDSTAVRAAAPARDLESNLNNGRVGDLYGRKVSVSGTFLPTDQVLVGTESPMRVLTALRTTGGHTVAVVRGTVPGNTIPAPPTGVQKVDGVILPTESSTAGEVAPGAPAGSLASVRLERLVQQWPTPMLDGYITQLPEQSTAQGLGTSQPPIPDVEGGRVRNQGYALQWWSFAAFGAVIITIAIRSLNPKPADQQD